MKLFYIKIKKYFKKIDEDNISEYAAECAYFTILSFIPFIMFFLTLVQYTNIEKETIYLVIKEVIPETMYQIIFNIIDEIYSKSFGTLSFTAIIALWSAGRGFFSLSKGLRYIYKTSDEKSNWITRIEGTLYTLVLIISIIAFLLILVFGNRINESFFTKYNWLNLIITIIGKIRIFLLIGIMFVVFLLIYEFVPRHKQIVKKQIYGAIFASVSWYVLSYFFSIYIDLFEGFTNMYGSLSSIILVMLWIYACMYTILLGAEINIIINDLNNKHRFWDE